MIKMLFAFINFSFIDVHKNKIFVELWYSDFSKQKQESLKLQKYWEVLAFFTYFLEFVTNNLSATITFVDVFMKTG